jgi:hypothetical protein
VSLTIGSPPYVDCRTYGRSDVARDCESWVAWMLEITAEALRVTDGAVLWVASGKTEDRNYWPACEGLKNRLKIRISLILCLVFDMILRAGSGGLIPDPTLTTTTLRGAEHVMAAHHPNVPGVSFKSLATLPGYVVGDDGSVWSNKLIGSRGRSVGPWRRLKPIHYTNGYLYVSLPYHRGGTCGRGIHRLVLEAFVGPCPPGMECLHVDGDRENNRVSNLRWGTRRENQADRVRHGTDIRGSDVVQAKVTAADILRIKALYATGDYSQATLGEMFGVSRSNISIIILGKSWRHVR